MTPRTQADLQWQALLDHLAGFASSAPGAARLRALEPAEHPTDASHDAALRACIELREQDAALPLTGFDDLAAVLDRTQRSDVVNAEEFVVLTRMLRLGTALRRAAASFRDRHPELADAIDSPRDSEQLVTRIEQCIDESGEIADSASSALRRARQAERDHRQQVQRLANRLMRQHSGALSGQFVTERDGRYVLPQRSDAHDPIDGLVIASSASGGTLFVEPRELTPVSNKLRIAQADVTREEARVLAELSELAQSLIEPVRATYAACITADVLNSLSRWAASSRSIVLTPRLEEGTHAIELKALRHPLLIAQGIDVVPNDIILQRGHGVVVSGPNAGGKTVCLKALGLACCMSRAGIPVPVAAGSKLGWFDPVLTDIGDEQSIAMSLSTFSAHVSNLAGILKAAGDRALVLLDEVAAGTDPEEGCALAGAVVGALLDRGATVWTTTHFESLKELADESARMQNASVGFNFDSLTPTFELQLGVPGPSSALHVAARFGIDAAIIDRARTLLPELSRRRQQLLETLAHNLEAARQARKEAEASEQRVRALEAQLEEQQRNVRQRAEAELARDQLQLTAAVRKSREQLRKAAALLADAPKAADALREAESLIDAAGHPIRAGGELDQATRKGPAAVDAPPSKGAQVYLTKLGVKAVVLEAPRKRRVVVQAGAMKLTVGLDDIQVTEKPPAEVKARKPKPRREQPLGEPPIRGADNTVDLRGLRVDEAISSVEVFADRLLSRGERGGYVLHGHGTGALRSAVRAHLGDVAYIAKSRPASREEGGDAFTVFWLRG